MSYQVLARKYRPQGFDEVVGQEHVTETWKNAILKNRLHHAYLLTGARGIGKTSLARIFAKALNCEQGPTAQPCNQCSNCQAITKGSFLDVQEIDGASNTSVESVRELREQVKYMPAAGKYKIYIIDEVHMLSNAAFNALLKTLEEPPPHVVFVFATTEVHKIPVTILSRCQRFDLRRLSQAQIREHLEKICREEKVGSDPASLDLLARAAEGSMRDSQSLLDMAIGLCGDKLQVEKIREMLGLAAATLIEDLTADCLQGKLPEALAKAEDLYHRGFDLRQIAVQWVEYLHDLTLLKAAGAAALGEGVTADQLAVMEKAIASVALPDLQIAFQTLYRGTEEIARSESPKILFDLMIVKLVHGTPYQSLPQILAGKGVAGASLPASPGQRGTQAPSPSPAAPVSQANSFEAPAPAALHSHPNSDVLDRVLKKRPQLQALLAPALARYWEGERFTVVFAPGAFEAEMFSEKRGVLAEALSQELGTPVQVEVRQEAKGRSAAPVVDQGPPLPPPDPVVAQAMEILNATLQEVKTHGHE
ncbi:DNA polymerase III subunit gamma/tau [Deltaproteobacteria bacterium PRO3]|nr:DNA polymerase III subunit gamma/tau [Deltaproteobacteria bacterium PRO3]